MDMGLVALLIIPVFFIALHFMVDAMCKSENQSPFLPDRNGEDDE